MHPGSTTACLNRLYAKVHYVQCVLALSAEAIAVEELLKGVETRTAVHAYLLLLDLQQDRATACSRSPGLRCHQVSAPNRTLADTRSYITQDGSRRRDLDRTCPARAPWRAQSASARPGAAGASPAGPPRLWIAQQQARQALRGGRPRPAVRARRAARAPRAAAAPPARPARPKARPQPGPARREARRTRGALGSRLRAAQPRPARAAGRVWVLPAARAALLPRRRTRRARALPQNAARTQGASRPRRRPPASLASGRAARCVARAPAVRRRSPRPRASRRRRRAPRAARRRARAGWPTWGRRCCRSTRCRRRRRCRCRCRRSRAAAGARARTSQLTEREAASARRASRRLAAQDNALVRDPVALWLPGLMQSLINAERLPGGGNITLILRPGAMRGRTSASAPSG